MKLNRIILIFFWLYIPAFSYLYSQSPVGIIPMKTKHGIVLDIADLKITYKMTSMPDSLKKNVLVDNEYILLIGRKYSKFVNSYYDKKGNNINVGQSAPNIDGRGLAGTEVYYDKTNKTMTVTTILFGSNDVYKYTETTPVINWKIGKNKKKIHGYLCQDAEGLFLGRKYIVWFTPEIPLSSGPWKLGGLPGLILQVSDDNGHYTFECLGIQKLNPKEPILEYDVKYTNISRIKLNQLIRRMHLNFDQYMESQGKILTKGSDKNISYPHNPIELE